jgi:hypothetical protein
MKFEGRWVHCLTCDTAAIRCPHCNNLSCTGGGCKLCHDDFEEVINMPVEERPPTKGLAKTGGGLEIILRSASPEAIAEQDAENLTARDWINREYQKMLAEVIRKENME